MRVDSLYFSADYWTILEYFHCGNGLGRLESA